MKTRHFLFLLYAVYVPMESGAKPTLPVYLIPEIECNILEKQFAQDKNLKLFVAESGAAMDITIISTMTIRARYADISIPMQGSTTFSLLAPVFQGKEGTVAMLKARLRVCDNFGILKFDKETDSLVIPKGHKVKIEFGGTFAISKAEIDPLYFFIKRNDLNVRLGSESVILKLPTKTTKRFGLSETFQATEILRLGLTDIMR